MLSQRSILLGLLVTFLIASSFSYQRALPNRKISFPQDHFSHPEFRTEWWYYTGHLETETGRSYGYQVTFFRYGLRDRQQGESGRLPLFTDLYMAHFALSDKMAKRFVFRDRVNRGLDGKAGALSARYLVWNEDWKVELKGETHVITVKDRKKALKLRLTPLKPPVLHGQNGLSQKGEGKGRASYYYSLTRLQTAGWITSLAVISWESIRWDGIGLASS
jgi:predicted secreted hydrolase